jgi:uncharacterized protein (TIGR02646 family)
MLNITTRISLTRSSKRLVKDLKFKQGGGFDSSSWGKIKRIVKHEMSGKLFLNQGLRCVYCERYLIALGHEMDHFAHKSDFPQFTFVPVNIFYSCSYCNSSSRKGQKSTISKLMFQYNQCEFSIIHPFYGNPDIEIIFSDADRVYFDRDSCTHLGKNTIDFFGWDDLMYTTIRAKSLTQERLKPLTLKGEMELIQEAISYKP